MVDIYLFTTLIQLKEFIGDIHNCVIVVGKLILKAILCLRYLLIMTILTTVTMTTMIQREAMVTNRY